MTHDFNDLFSIQLATVAPYTKGNVNSTLHLMGHTMTPRQIMVKSKELKAKIGKKRMLYYVVTPDASGKPVEKIEKVWEDEFEDLQTKLADFIYMEHNGTLPRFAHKDL